MAVWNPPDLISRNLHFFKQTFEQVCTSHPHPLHCAKLREQEGAQSVFSAGLWASSLFCDICVHRAGHARFKHSKGQTLLPTCTLAPTHSFSRLGGGKSRALQIHLLIPLHWIKFPFFPQDFAQKSLYHSSLGHKLIWSGEQPMFWWERGSCCRRFNSIRTDSNMS